MVKEPKTSGGMKVKMGEKSADERMKRFVGFHLTGAGGAVITSPHICYTAAFFHRC